MMSANPVCVDSRTASRRRCTSLGPGVLLCAGLALAAQLAGNQDWLTRHGLGALTLAILLGMLTSNLLLRQLPERALPGIDFSRQTLLRLGVVLYGFRLTLQDVGQVGLAGVVIDALMLVSTFGLAWWVGTRLARLDRDSVLLIGAGSAICGAAAVMATQQVVRARPQQVTVAVATVVLFGTLSIFFYPLLFALNQAWAVIPVGKGAFGIFAGSTIHEVAQVVVAARAVGQEAADTALIAKLVRVMMLGPFLLLLSLALRRVSARAGQAGAGEPAEGAPGAESPSLWASVPWFAFAFMGVVALNSLHLLPGALREGLVQGATLLLATAMAALGLATRLDAIRRAGARPLLLAAFLAGWLVAGGALVNRVVHSFL